MGEIADAVEWVRAAHGVVAGLLRLNVPHIALPLAITPVVLEMTRFYPDLRVEVLPSAAIEEPGLFLHFPAVLRRHRSCAPSSIRHALSCAPDGQL
jgi:DNA-binding transcriptional LysR family regulator